MPDFLLIQLYGVLASWGDIAVGEHRPSLGHPTKSAVTGLLAAAIGVDRSDDAVHLQLGQKYGVAVCVRAPGELLRDYHTVQVPGGKRDYASRRDELLLDTLNLNTILSQRDYRTNAFYQVAVWCNDENPPYPLDELRAKLLMPNFVLYLGRKSCPMSLPLFPVLMSGSSLKDSFDAYPLSQANPWIEALDSDALISYYWEQGNLTEADLGMEPSMNYPRRDQIRSRKRWQFANRDEFYYASNAKGEK